MNIHQATKSYENWMRSCMPVVETHLRLKHKQMRKSLFLFSAGRFTGGLNFGRSYAPTCVMLPKYWQ